MYNVTEASAHKSMMMLNKQIAKHDGPPGMYNRDCLAFVFEDASKSSLELQGPIRKQNAILTCMG